MRSFVKKIKSRLVIWWKKGRLTMFIIFWVLVCFALLSLGCCVFAVFWGMIEDTELGRFIIMKIKNKYSGGDI